LHGQLSDADAAAAAADRLSAVQRDFDQVRAELAKMIDRYNVQQRKHADHKLAMKNKLHSVRSVACCV